MEPSDDSNLPATLADVAPKPMSAIKAGNLADRRELALLSRDYFTEHLDAFVKRIFDPDPLQVLIRGRLRLQFETLQWLANRGWGKVPQEIRLDTEDDSLEGWMRRIATERIATAVTAEVVTDTPSEKVDDDE